jgi:hypothetical protein
LDIHPNHFFIFGLKKKAITNNQVVPETRLSDLKILLRYLLHVLNIIETLDPGVTMQRATMLKKLATVRVSIFKTLKWQLVSKKLDRFNKKNHLLQNSPAFFCGRKGSISPTCLRTAFTHADPKLPKDSQVITVFLRFLNLRAQKLYVIRW